jgi:hypothetical protein
MTDGNAGWLTESGRRCVSRQNPACLWYTRPPFPVIVPLRKLPVWNCTPGRVVWTSRTRPDCGSHARAASLDVASIAVDHVVIMETHGISLSTNLFA